MAGGCRRGSTAPAVALVHAAPGLPSLPCAWRCTQAVNLVALVHAAPGLPSLPCAWRCTQAVNLVALVHAAPGPPCTWRCTQAVKPLRRCKRRFGRVLAHRGAMNPVTSHGGRVLQRGKCALHGGCVLHTGDVCFGGGTGGL